MIRVLGLLGALDPHKHKMNQGMIQLNESNSVSTSDTKLSGENSQPGKIFALHSYHSLQINNVKRKVLCIVCLLRYMHLKCT